MQPQAAPSTVGYMAYKGNTSAGKTNDNVSPPYSTKNGQSIAGSMTLSSLVKNLTGTQGCASGTHAPQVTPQVSPNASQQQNSYIHNNIPPMQIPNQLPPSPYFPSPFPPPPLLHPLMCQGSVHANNSPIHAPLPHASQLNVPPTPYVNQMAVNQHMGTQPAPILPRISTSPTNLQPPAKTLLSQVPSNIQLQQLPFVDAPPAPTQDSFVKNTASPVLRDTRSKSKNDNVSPPYSTKNGQSISGNMTPSSLVKNLTGTQGCASGTHAPQVTPQVSPNASQQQNSYIHNNIPPMQIPNQLPPSPYFPSPFPPPPLLHPLMCQTHPQLLYQIFQQQLLL